MALARAARRDSKRVSSKRLKRRPHQLGTSCWPKSTLFSAPAVTAPDASAAWAPAEPWPDETLTRALARAHRWKRMLEEGAYRSAAEIAEAESITRSFVSRLLRLTLVAPDIVEAILDGRQPKAMQLGELTEAIPSEWEKQWKALFCQEPKRVEVGRFAMKGHGGRRKAA